MTTCIPQDFDYPDRYFEAEPAERREIVRELSNPVDADTILAELDEWDEFHGTDEDEEKFQREVDTIVERLNSSAPASDDG